VAQSNKRHFFGKYYKLYVAMHKNTEKLRYFSFTLKYMKYAKYVF